MKKKNNKQKRKTIGQSDGKTINKLFFLVGILVLTIIVYSNSINNDFTYQFDDDLYVTNNADIKALTIENISRVFSKSYVGLYLPLTMLTFMVEFSMFELDPMPYHVTNLILHLIGTVLVFLLTYKIKPNVYIASVVTFVFAIHPMHVESVSWISERKDVLYAIFYLSGLIAYLNFLKNRSAKNYLLTVLFFVLSLFSKAVAVSFPLFLVAFDWYNGRKLLNVKLILEKIPFFALSLTFGLVGIYFTSTAADTSTPDIALMYRPFIVSDAIMIYLYKFIVPFKLMIYYYYPEVSTGKLASGFYISSAILVLIFVTTIIWVIKAGEKKRDLILGLLFFIIPTFFILQLIPAGRAYAAERYTYLSYIGLAYIFAIFTNDVIRNKSQNFISLRATLIGVIVFFAAGFSYLTWDRNKDWTDSLTIFTDLIEKNPEHGHPYLIRGITYVQFGKNKLALQDYNKSILLNPHSAKALANRSSTKGMLGDLEGALDDANRSLKIRPGYTNALNNRATAYFFSKDYESALADYTTLLAKDSLKVDLYRKRIMVLEKLDRRDELLNDYLTLTRLLPANHSYFAKVGEIFYHQNKNQEAVEYINRSIQLKPTYYQPLFIRGNAYFKLGEYSKALSDFSRYAEITKEPDSYYNSGMCFLKLNKIEDACKLWGKARELGHKDAPARIEQYCR